MSKSHNKKRNTTLVYEFLVLSISKALVEGDKKRSSIALKILKRRFKPGTELHKEFRLANSLLKTTVSSDAVAMSILQEAKLAARKHDVSALDREKSFLIHEINCCLGPETFEQRVDNYVDHATISSLLSSWRKSSYDITNLALFEDKLVKMLTLRKDNNDFDFTCGDVNEQKLIMKVMSKRIDERYSSLSSMQRSILHAYATSNEKLQEEATNVRTVLKDELEKYISIHEENSELNELLARLAIVEQKSNDELVEESLKYAELVDELRKDDGDAQA